MAEKQYRPYLTHSEISTILSSLKREPIESHIRLIRKLEVCMFKISAEHLTPAYVPAPTMVDKLELDGPPIAPKDMSTYRLECYRKWVDNPLVCTAAELMRAQEYMFENDLMSPEQEAMFLSSQEQKGR